MVIFPLIVLFGKALYVHVGQDCRRPVSLHIEPAAHVQIPPAPQQSALILIDRLVSTVEEEGFCGILYSHIRLNHLLAACDYVDGVIAYFFVLSSVLIPLGLPAVCLIYIRLFGCLLVPFGFVKAQLPFQSFHGLHARRKVPSDRV